MPIPRLILLLVLGCAAVWIVVTLLPDRWFAQPPGAEAYRRAEQLLDRGEHERALEEYQSVLRAAPPRELAIKAQFGVAQCLLELGETRQATGVLSNLVGHFPDHPLAEKAKQQLAEHGQSPRDDDASKPNGSESDRPPDTQREPE